MICFVPGFGANSFSDPSYHLPAFYQLWALWGPSGRSRLLGEGRRGKPPILLCRRPIERTGLAPDYANFDGTPHSRRLQPDVRQTSPTTPGAPSAIGQSIQPGGAAIASAQARSDAIQRFLYSRASTLSLISTRSTAGRSLRAPLNRHGRDDGSRKPRGERHSGSKGLRRELWGTPVPSGEQRYYDGLLYMISLLHTSGQFRIWGPTAVAKHTGSK